MTFPGAGAQVYYNEAGEPLGWDYPGYDDGPSYDDHDFPDEPDDDYEVCDECGEEFDDPGDLEQHRRDDHKFSG